MLRTWLHAAAMLEFLSQAMVSLDTEKIEKNYRITFQLVEFSLQCETINSYFVWEVGNQKNVSLTWIKRDAFTFILFRVDLGDESTHALDRMACKGD